MTHNQIQRQMRDAKYLGGGRGKIGHPNGSKNNYLYRQHDRYVYFILHAYPGYMKTIHDDSSGTRHDGWDEKSFVKVGIAKEPCKRILAIQSSSPVDLSLLGYLPGNESLEKRLHRFLEEHHERGEWFRYNREVHEYIDCLYLLDADGQKQESWYEKKYPQTYGRHLYLGDAERKEMMREAFGGEHYPGELQTPEARKEYLDEFNDIIYRGDMYYKLGDFNDVVRISERSADRIMYYFKHYFGGRLRELVEHHERIHGRNGVDFLRWKLFPPTDTSSDTSDSTNDAPDGGTMGDGDEESDTTSDT